MYFLYFLSLNVCICICIMINNQLKESQLWKGGAALAGSKWKTRNMSLTPMLPACQVKDVFLYLVFLCVISFFHFFQVVKKRMHFCIVLLYFFLLSPQCCPLITKRIYFRFLHFLLYCFFGHFLSPNCFSLSPKLFFWQHQGIFNMKFMSDI